MLVFSLKKNIKIYRTKFKNNLINILDHLLCNRVSNNKENLYLTLVSKHLTILYTKYSVLCVLINIIWYCLLYIYILF